LIRKRVQSAVAVFLCQQGEATTTPVVLPISLTASCRGWTRCSLLCTFTEAEGRHLLQKSSPAEGWWKGVFSSSRANDPMGQCGVAGCARIFPKPSVSQLSREVSRSWPLLGLGGATSGSTNYCTVRYCTVCSRGSVDLLPASDGGRGRTLDRIQILRRTRE
jgi:hypothetical protein